MTYIKVTRLGIAILVLVAGVLTAIGKPNAASKRNRAKAKYFYTKGSTQEAVGDYAGAYELYKKAYETDNSFTEAAFSYGELRFMLPDTFTSDTEKEKSLALLKKHADLYPKDRVTLETYAYNARSAQKTPEAIRVYKSLIKDHPGNTDTYLVLASAYLDIEEPDSALDILRAYERIEGESQESLLHKASVYFLTQDTIGLFNELKGYRDRHPDDIYGLMSLSEAYEAFEMRDSSKYLLDEALRLNPNDGNIKFTLGRWYAEEGDTAQTFQLYKEAFDDFNPDFEKQMGLLIDFSNMMDNPGADYKKADALYEYAAGKYSNDALFLDVYANYEVQKRNYDRAYELRKKALALEPENVGLLRSMMALSSAVYKEDEAIRAYENFPNQEDLKDYDNTLPYITALRLKEDYKNALRTTDELIKDLYPNLSLADSISDEKLNELMEAEITFQDAYNMAVLYEIAGDIYAKMGSDEDIERSYENALALSFGYNWSALNNYAWYLVDSKKVKPGSEEFERAKEMSHKAIEYTSDNPQASFYDTYAWILFLDHDYKEALECQEAALELLEDLESSWDFYSHYGDILFMMGQPEEALVQWQKALEMEPDNKLLKKKVTYKTFFYE